MTIRIPHALVLICLFLAHAALAAEKPQECNTPKPGEVIQAYLKYWYGPCRDGLADGDGVQMQVKALNENATREGKITFQLDAGGTMSSGQKSGRWEMFEYPYEQPKWYKSATVTFQNGEYSSIEMPPGKSPEVTPPSSWIDPAMVFIKLTRSAQISMEYINQLKAASKSKVPTVPNTAAVSSSDTNTKLDEGASAVVDMDTVGTSRSFSFKAKK